MIRPDQDVYFMHLARVVATRGECIRRRVGAVITDIQGRILSTGTNGVAPGHPPCIFKPCPGADAPSGTGLEECMASHAEISALVYLPDPVVAHSIYVTAEPCISCVKAISLTHIKRIIYMDPYPTNGRHLWDKEWSQIPEWRVNENTLQEKCRWKPV